MEDEEYETDWVYTLALQRKRALEIPAADNMAQVDRAM